jgi:hypothetical protein
MPRILDFPQKFYANAQDASSYRNISVNVQDASP